MTAIVVTALSKSFLARPPPPAGWRRFGALLRPPPAISIPAVHDLSFAIRPGERVAFIGPNGAGKSTTLKMLTGILRPSAGRAEVAGFVPWEQRRQLAQRIGILFGQRSQLWHHLAVRRSFELLARIYGIAPSDYRDQLQRLAARFAIEELLDRPVAQLSLGQRLRCEIAAALLHRPKLLLLDEPTIGLDVTAKVALRDHLDALSREDGTTILLTSHDSGDIERICERVIVVDHGTLLLDRPLQCLRRTFQRHRVVVLMTDEERPELVLPGVVVAASEPYRLTLSVDTAAAPLERVVAAALERFTLRDLVIENPPLEEIVKAIYRGEIGAGGVVQA
ncbi:MAG: ATP-binding cassette domain-containing protein [Alphaproteobacteria bacterium]|nr:ATP-binding cassette domain-containing protein [Alphaproteobacteria bacterium]